MVAKWIRRLSVMRLVPSNCRHVQIALKIWRPLTNKEIHERTSNQQERLLHFREVLMGDCSFFLLLSDKLLLSWRKKERRNKKRKKEKREKEEGKAKKIRDNFLRVFRGGKFVALIRSRGSICLSNVNEKAISNWKDRSFIYPG